MKYEFDVESKGQISDGYHTFDELYNHRMILFAVICNTYKDNAWKSWQHHDGTMYNDYFIVGVSTPEGDYSYHYHKDNWDKFDVKVLEKAPEWDGHQPSDIDRLFSLVKPVGKRRLIVTFDCNNGYTCSCCGRWWEETEEYELDDDVNVREFIDNLKARCESNSDYGRMGVDSAYLVSEQIV